MTKRNLYGSIALNLFTLLSVIVCLIILCINNPNTFRMFTTQSNVIAGITAGIILVYEVLIILKKKDKLPDWLRIVKMVTTTAVTLTLLVVLFYLGFVAIAEGYSYFIMFRNTNICFHLLTPISAILSFILFEGGNKINFKFTFLNLIHMISYSIFYSINVFTHLTPDGKVDRKYDWYYFVLGENWTFVFVVIGVLTLTYLIGFSLWILNRKFSKNMIK